MRIFTDCIVKFTEHSKELKETLQLFSANELLESITIVHGYKIIMF